MTLIVAVAVIATVDDNCDKNEGDETGGCCCC